MCAISVAAEAATRGAAALAVIAFLAVENGSAGPRTLTDFAVVGARFQTDLIFEGNCPRITLYAYVYRPLAKIRRRKNKTEKK